ncbi:MAG TPA: hypothetical protein VLL25_06095 [Acidimicrobiales bacterium]|nr:hypothetical protein [Acidimicrobiales bacterium]
MPMREDCRHFQSRTYDDGEVARLCVLNLAPEAPWRCPANCPRYERDVLVAGFVTGSLVRPPVESEPDDPPGDIAGLLQEADAIVTSVGPEVVEEVDREEAPPDRKWWQVWKRRHGGRGRDDGDDGQIHLSNR